jgi:hypothetical protein
MAFEPSDTVEVSGVLRDALLYREHALAGHWPRSAPEYISDDEISDELRYMATQVILPWLLDEAFFEATWEKTKCRS